MRLHVIGGLVILQAALSLARSYNERFDEDLTLRSLPDGKLLAHFDFTTHVDATMAPGSQLLDYNLFPKVIGQVLQQYDVDEMHLTFSQGRWHYDHWGYPPEQSAGTGVELWAWMQNHTNIDARWHSLTNTLSGLFCASLNFIDETLTTQPALSFGPDDATKSTSQLRFGYLPHENVCTENLTPWIKLLPCKAKSGIASLLNAHKIYNSYFHSMSIHAKRQCKDNQCTMELKQAVVSVMDPVRDTNRRDWSLEEVFARVPHGACPVANQSFIRVAVNDDDAILSPEPTMKGKDFIMYDLKQVNESLDIRMTWAEDTFHYPLASALPMISAHRYLTGHGQERGGIQVTLQNRHDAPMPIVYYDSIPWFLKLYLHTLDIQVVGDNNNPQNDIVEQMLYQPAVDRARPSMLECKLLLPARSTVTLSMDLDKVFLKYTEHRPDANRGFDIGPAVITAPILDEVDNRTMRIYTDTLLVSLPTPDFSMPYNVITLTCTVIALFFGSIFNLLTRRFQVLKVSKE
ncbi:hypothetical protein O0I10_009922 [Lichtheimia ornata]|uniref:Uncharacterized protein n=1 Tax=Lichtheimia ornata TaxID=688661 RepID=A0AAD7UVK4_9FUNG|nr:uncharacterized protein O0I10_009922 [Lichtheimia ornata]KAJ8654354.1 hypothetical protein O0I10_009922 [Lichtheimia ornata]